MKSLHPLTGETGAAAIVYALPGMLFAVIVAGSAALAGADLAGFYRTVCGTASAAIGVGAC